MDRFNRHKTWFSLAFCLFLITAVWPWWIAPSLTKLPHHFSYRADIFSLDNFYDENQQQFLGEKRSVTQFSYEVVDQKQGTLIIKNLFDVRTVTGEKIFTVERLYGIHPKTGQHTANFGDKNRNGHLFAPKNLKKGVPFTYWHINYDAPALMTFAGEENLFGLPVYRYESRYQGVNIDQTENLKFLPGVGVTRGIQLDPYLQLWIEPVTGRMVKYKDETIAYYYNLATKERLHPWNKFSNTYQRSSITKQVKIAKRQKAFFRMAEMTTPLFLALVVSVALLLGLAKRKGALILGVVGVLGLGVDFVAPILIQPAEDPIKIGISRWVPFGNQAYDQNVQGFKEALVEAGYKEGTHVTYYLETANADSNKQRQIAQLFIDRHVDLVYSQTTPGTLILKEKISDRPIVFSIVTYPVEAGVIQSLQNSGNNLVGTRNWVPVEKQLAVFRDIVPTVTSIGFVHRMGELNSTIQLKEMTDAARPFGIRVVEIAGKNLTELIGAIEASQGINSLFSACDTLVQGEAEKTIIAFAHKNKLPSFSCNSTGPLHGDLVGTVADLYAIGKQAGEKAALILEGATPASLTTDTVTRPFIYVNQKTADLLDIQIPQNILAEAKEIINNVP
ncbi:MAG: ABC transporter substrate binding protein [Nitrospirota bacterium]